jgi:hypothetical protein
LAASERRIITPAFDQSSTSSIEVTRATISTSPLTRRYVYRNWSEVPQISAPPASIVNTLEAYVVVPARAEPMSRDDQPDGRGSAAVTAPSLTSTLSNTARAAAAGRWLVTASPT